LEFHNGTSKWISTKRSYLPFIFSNLPATVFDTKFSNAGHRPKFKLETVFQRIEDVDKESCHSLRFVAGGVGMPLSTISRMKKDKKIKAYTMALKPKLNNGCRSKRLYHC
jgi:hypothetical protein